MELPYAAIRHHIAESTHLLLTTTEEMTVTYAPTAKSGDLWLPADMRELYVGRDRKLECEATYRNIRQFQVSTEVRLP